MLEQEDEGEEGDVREGVEWLHHVPGQLDGRSTLEQAISAGPRPWLA